jgi:hypothetical protein
MVRDPAPPWDYLHDASISSLESFELTRLNHVANLRREMVSLLDQWVEDAAQALLARWILDDRALTRPVAPEVSPQASLPFAKPLPDLRAVNGMASSEKPRRSRSLTGR